MNSFRAWLIFTAATVRYIGVRTSFICYIVSAVSLLAFYIVTVQSWSALYFNIFAFNLHFSAGSSYASMLIYVFVVTVAVRALSMCFVIDVIFIDYAIEEARISIKLVVSFNWDSALCLRAFPTGCCNVRCAIVAISSWVIVHTLNNTKTSFACFALTLRARLTNDSNAPVH